jgi:uncharacterized C2H2 Zn-finger protein
MIANSMSARTEAGGRIWSCNVCGVTNRDKTKMKRHVETHIEGFIHSCPYCNQQMKTRRTLKVHLERVHNIVEKEQQGLLPLVSHRGGIQ